MLKWLFKHRCDWDNDSSGCDAVVTPHGDDVSHDVEVKVQDSSGVIGCTCHTCCEARK